MRAPTQTGLAEARQPEISVMDIMKQYAAHQTALMRAQEAGTTADRRSQFAAAARIAGQISAFQRDLGAAASCAWSMAEVSAAARA